LFAGLSLDGSVLKQDAEDNKKLYGREVSAKEILIEGRVRNPRAAHGLDSALAKYSPKGGQAFNGSSVAAGAAGR
jgi:lipid-binding SYLF domain-containing protein